MSSASRVRLLYAKETAYRTIGASPAMRELPFNTGDAFVAGRGVLTSQQVPSDRRPRKTRAGVNEPSKSLAFELQWETFDEILAGGFGTPWTGGYTVTADVTATAGGVITLDSGEWVDHPGPTVGSFVLYDDDGTDRVLLVTEIEDDDLTVTTVDGSAPALTAVASPASKTMVFGVAGFSLDLGSGDESIEFAETGSTITVGDDHPGWEIMGFHVGDNLFVDAGSAANEGWHKIVGIDNRVLTVEGALTDETITAGTIEFVTDAGTVENGNDLESFVFEEQFLDHGATGAFRPTRGAVVNSIQLNLQPSAMVVVTLDLQAGEIEDFAAATMAGSFTPYEEREAFDTFTGRMLMDGTESYISGINATLGNNQARDIPLFHRSARRMVAGVPEITGTINAKFETTAESEKFMSETIFGMAFRMEDPAGHGYEITIASAKYTGDTISVGDIEVEQALPFTVEPSTSSAEITLRRQPETR